MVMDTATSVYGIVLENIKLHTFVSENCHGYLDQDKVWCSAHFCLVYDMISVVSAQMVLVS